MGWMGGDRVLGRGRGPGCRRFGIELYRVRCTVITVIYCAACILLLGIYSGYYHIHIFSQIPRLNITYSFGLIFIKGLNLNDVTGAILL